MPQSHSTIASNSASTHHALQKNNDVTPANTHGIMLGNREIPSRYFLAPLAGYTHHAFRIAVRELGGLGLATTDLVHCNHLIKGSRKSEELIATSPRDKPLSIQIYGSKLYELTEAAKCLIDRGYQGIDLNMGCPMAKINGQGGGARLMCDEGGACQSVSALVNAVSVPVTVKMRLGWDAETITAPALAREFEQLGVAAVTIHGRTRAQGFHGNVNLQGITDVVHAVDKMPIIGNGDVRNVQDALAMRAQTGCAAVAIGRGALIDPWIFRKLRDHQNKQPVKDPEDAEKIEFLVRHYKLMTNQHGDYTVMLFRKFAAWYGATLGIPEALEDRLRRFESHEEFYEIVAQIREQQGQRISTTPTAFLKVPNGPVDKW